MSSVDALRERAEGFLKRPANNLPVAAPAAAGLESMGAPTARDFSVFIPGHAEHALELAARFMEIANATPGDQGLAAVLDEADRVAAQEDDRMVKYALMVFITHHPEGRRLPIPPLAERAPDIIPPSDQAVLSGLEGLGALGVEAQLDYFREDTAVNEHHQRWHVVYPGGGHPNPANPAQRITKNRQGELFWYMHQQMLARYDTERKAFNLGRVQELKNYTAPIPEGYNANLPNFSHRKPNVAMHDMAIGQGVNYKVSDHDQRRKRLLAAAESGKLQKGTGTVPVTIELLSSTAESTIGSVDSANWSNPLSFYGSHHNFGHVLIADLRDPMGPFPQSPGVMTRTSTAVRDPVFYRWHRHVDETMFLWQQTLQPHDLKTGMPPVKIRKSLNGGVGVQQSPDIMVCLLKNIPGSSAPNFDGQAFANNTFGGDANWAKALSSFNITNGTLQTVLRKQTIALPGGGTGTKPYLDQEEFCYFLRFENTSNQAQKITVRIFLVAKDFADERRLWIEMDKFAHSLTPKQKSVVFRPGKLSAVVRKPARRPPDPPPQPHPGQDPNYCDCGWPYHLLLPRGTEAGMDFRLMVMVTDHQADLVGAEKKCGSMSFCGVKDADYPDKRPMGYPFDRPFSGKVSDALARADLIHIATRDFKIKHTVAP
jgi:tyrosinase